VTGSERTDLQRRLLHNSDTVTHFLEMLTGEPLMADIIGQDPLMSVTGDGFEMTAGQDIVQRRAVLRGHTTGLPYVYAESTFVPARLPETARSQLERTSDPIGRVLVAHGLRPKREDLPYPEGVGAGETDAVVAVASVSEVVLSRGYRLILDDLPVFAIREWFFRTVLAALDRQATA